jgi:hypothetical protein
LLLDQVLTAGIKANVHANSRIPAQWRDTRRQIPARQGRHSYFRVSLPTM